MLSIVSNYKNARLSRLTIRSDFDSNYWNRFDPTILILEIELKSKSISSFLKLT